MSLARVEEISKQGWYNCKPLVQVLQQEASVVGPKIAASNEMTKIAWNKIKRGELVFRDKVNLEAAAARRQQQIAASQKRPTQPEGVKILKLDQLPMRVSSHKHSSQIPDLRPLQGKEQTLHYTYDFGGRPDLGSMREPNTGLLNNTSESNYQGQSRNEVRE